MKSLEKKSHSEKERRIEKMGRKKLRDYTTKLLQKMYNRSEVDHRNFYLDKKNPQTINNLNQIQIVENQLVAFLNIIIAKKICMCKELTGEGAAMPSSSLSERTSYTGAAASDSATAVLP
ncbi:hypothetical protein ACOSQ3_008739 [Xanthoceras sorbifolium]